MSDMTSVEQQQYVVTGGGGGGGGAASPKHHCKDCGLYFESDKSLEVHLRYHQENLLSQWATQAQQEESNNNNSKAGNHNSHVGPVKRDSVTAPADSSEPSSRPPSEGPPGPTSVQQQQQQQQPISGQQSSQQGYNHFQAPMFSESGYFMQNEPPYILPHAYSPPREESQNGNYTRYHPYQHQRHYPPERANSVSSTSPRSPLQCDKCGAVYDDANQLTEHVRTSHPSSPGSYSGQGSYRQIGTSPPQQGQQQQQAQQQSQMHSSPPHPGQQQQQQQQQTQTQQQQQQASSQQQQQQQQQTGYDYNGSQVVKSEVKQEPEEQAEILDLDSHKLQTHRYEEELMRLHQQQQEMQMQLHQQQQQQAMQQHQQRGGPHSGQFLRSQHIPVEPPRHPGSPIISSTQQMPSHQIPGGLLQQPPKPPPLANQSWKSNEARRPKTYNCTACNKWFTSSGHLKRHYNTTLHKNAVKQSNQPDPANLPISAHHHPGRDAVSSSGSRAPPVRSPELSSSGSPPNLMAGPSGEAARGLLHTPTLYANSNSSSSSSESSGTLAQQQQQQQQQQQTASAIHLGSSMVSLNSPVQSPMGHHQMGSPSPQLGHHLPMGSPSQMGPHHPMNSPISPMPAAVHLSSPSPMGSHPHHMTSPSPIMPAPMNSPPMGASTMPHQPYPNALPPHVITTTSIPGLLESITNQLTTIGNELPGQQHPQQQQQQQQQQQVQHQQQSQHQQQQLQQSQDMLPGFGTFSNHQRPLPSFTQFAITGFLVGHNQPVNVGGLSHEENLPQDRSFDSPGSTYDPYRGSPPKYDSLAGMEVMQGTDGMIIKHYEVSNDQPRSDQLEANNNLPRAKEERNPNAGKAAPKDDKKSQVVLTKEHQVTSTNTGSHYISQDGFHKCIECDKVFNKACYLTQHNKSFHSGDKPFKCNQCGKRFPLEYLHAEHLQKHAGDKPYKCEICPKQFNHKTDLRRHMCLHTGEKPYACDNCGKGFIRKDHMMKHLETHKKKSNNHNVHLRA
ncbi:GATA zinc finger domain-containing protein 10 [Orussus abietinus]|uniref:GATA zinc finger domain-containing protein 10 n=1 Tax=Orussus abietinus TaxID=222816 RepID=UPI0006266631|nr:GATA zinc finger domain-containing protein 10 [Orussus abietinus]